MGKWLLLVCLVLAGCGDDDPPDCSLPPRPIDADAGADAEPSLDNDVIEVPKGCDPANPGQPL